MTGTDPAIRAADSGMEASRYPHRQMPEYGIALTAAREALAPIRARHRPIRECGGRAWCAHDGLDWPCPDAKDAYTTEELNHD